MKAEGEWQAESDMAALKANPTDKANRAENLNDIHAYRATIDLTQWDANGTHGRLIFAPA
jgi:hypothetical protein